MAKQQISTLYKYNDLLSNGIAAWLLFFLHAATFPASKNGIFALDLHCLFPNLCFSRNFANEKNAQQDGRLERPYGPVGLSFVMTYSFI